MCFMLAWWRLPSKTAEHEEEVCAFRLLTKHFHLLPPDQPKFNHLLHQSYAHSLCPSLPPEEGPHQNLDRGYKILLPVKCISSPAFFLCAWDKVSCSLGWLWTTEPLPLPLGCWEHTSGTATTGFKSFFSYTYHSIFGTCLIPLNRAE